MNQPFRKLKHQPFRKLKRVRRLLALLTLAAFLSLNVLARPIEAAVGPGIPQNGAQQEAEQKEAATSSANCANASDFFKCLRQWAKSIKKTTDAQFAFLHEVNNDGKIEGTKVDFQGPNGSPENESTFVAGPKSAIGHKYDGNPFFSINTNHTLYQPYDPHQAVISGSDTGKVRFVLTDVVFAHEPDVEGLTGKSEEDQSNIYVFRNEYNPSVAIAFRIITNSIGLGAVAASDDKHFVYYRGCDPAIMDDEYHVADVESSDPDWFTDENDRDKVEDTVSSFNNVEVCDINNSVVASMLKEARIAVAQAIDALFDWIKDALLNVLDIGTLSSNQGLVNAWKTIRDFVNLIFVLLLSVVAFSNILRIDTEKYGVRALLPRLIFAVIAVNFSFLLVQIMTNVAYIISQPFLSKAMDLLSAPPASGSIIDPSGSLGNFIVTIVLVLAVLFGFVVLLVFFVIRILMIWMLAALSPFVFLLMVLPLTRSLASQWWKNTFKWVFMGPIAFVILFIAAEMLRTAGGKNDDVNGPDFLLTTAFFVAASIAAVMIPLKLGGSVMGDALKGAKRGGLFGGRAGGRVGMAVADKLPGGGGTSVGTKIRAAKAGLEARGELRDARAEEYLHEQMIDGKGVGRLAGADEGQVTRAHQQAIHRAQQEMATIPPTGKMRIAYAGNSKNVDDNGHVWDEEGNDLGALSADEQALSKQRISREAAFSELAQSGIASPTLGKMYASSGLQQNAQHDPALAALERSGTYNSKRAEAKVSYATYDDMKGWDDRYLEGAKRAATGTSTDATRDYDNTALASIKQLDKTRAAYAVTRGHRNSMQRDSQRELMLDIANAGGFADPSVNNAVKQYHNKDDIK